MSIVAAPKLVDVTGRPIQKTEYPDAFAVPNIEIVGPRLLILPAKNVDYETPTGLFVPAAAQERHSKGIVLLTGDGILLENGARLDPRVPVGMEIIYARYAGVELTLNEVDYLIIQESDIRCILTYRGNILTKLRRTEAEEAVD